MNYQTAKGLPSYNLLSMITESAETERGGFYKVPLRKNWFSVEIVEIITSHAKWMELLNSVGKEKAFHIVQGVIDEAKTYGERVRVTTMNDFVDKRQMMKVLDLGKGSRQIFTVLFVDYQLRSGHHSEKVTIWVR